MYSCSECATAATRHSVRRIRRLLLLPVNDGKCTYHVMSLCILFWCTRLGLRGSGDLLLAQVHYLWTCSYFCVTPIFIYIFLHFGIVACFSVASATIPGVTGRCTCVAMCAVEMPPSRNNNIAPRDVLVFDQRWRHRLKQHVLPIFCVLVWATKHHCIDTVMLDHCPNFVSYVNQQE